MTMKKSSLKPFGIYHGGLQGQIESYTIETFVDRYCQYFVRCLCIMCAYVAVLVNFACYLHKTSTQNRVGKVGLSLSGEWR